MSVVTIFEPISVGLPIMDTLEREIRAGRWQNAAAISGRNQHSLRMQYDDDYRKLHNAPVVAAPVIVPSDEAFKVPWGWKSKLRSRMNYLGVTLSDLAKVCGCTTMEVEVSLFRGAGLTERVFKLVDDYLWPKDVRTISAAKLNKVIPPEAMPRDGLRAYSSDRKKKRPASREWVAGIKARMVRLGWTDLDLTNATGITRRCLTEHAFGPNGYCSDRLSAKIEAAITFAEKVAA